MFNVLSLKSEAFGLDIADSALKIVKIRKKKNFFVLSSWGEIEIKPGLVEDGEIKKEDELAKAIRESLGQVNGEKLKTKNVVASLPEKKSFLQVIPMPKLKEEELRSAILFEAENYVPLPIEEVYLDYQIIPPLYDHLDHIDVLIVASPKKIIDPYVSCLKRAGLFPKALEIESQSVARALIKNETVPSPIFLIDFGRNATGFVIYSGCSLRFTSTVPISAHQLTQAIAHNLKIDLTESEDLKIKYGLQIPKENTKTKKPKKEIEMTKQIFEAMVPILSDLAGQIKKCLNYYSTHAVHEHLSSLDKNGREVEKIILCGGGANLKGLTEFLSFSLKIPVEIGNPWVNILSPTFSEVPKLSFPESLGYSTALGLALRGIKDK